MHSFRLVELLCSTPVPPRLFRCVADSFFAIFQQRCRRNLQPFSGGFRRRSRTFSNSAAKV
jgi:hypothetical protein